jgi:hypothetical protein
MKERSKLLLLILPLEEFKKGKERTKNKKKRKKEEKKKRKAKKKVNKGKRSENELRMEYEGLGENYLFSLSFAKQNYL